MAPKPCEREEKEGPLALFNVPEILPELGQVSICSHPHPNHLVLYLPVYVMVLLDHFVPYPWSMPISTTCVTVQYLELWPNTPYPDINAPNTRSF